MAGQGCARQSQPRRDLAHRQPVRACLHQQAIDRQPAVLGKRLQCRYGFSSFHISEIIEMICRMSSSAPTSPGPPLQPKVRDQISETAELRIVGRETMLFVMRRSLHPRCRTFRSLLTLALLAWTAFAFEAMAHPLVMSGQMGASTTAGQAMSPQCKGMTSTHSVHAASIPASSHPDGYGHGCCAFGHCDCASFCSSIAGVPSLVMTWPSPHDPALSPVDSGAPPVVFAPRLRPPIA